MELCNVKLVSYISLYVKLVVAGIMEWNYVIMPILPASADAYFGGSPSGEAAKIGST
jgi:hypothetical protein